MLINEGIIFGSGRARAEHWSLLKRKNMKNHANLYVPGFRMDFNLYLNKNQLVELRAAIDKAINHFQESESQEDLQTEVNSRQMKDPFFKHKHGEHA